MLKKCNKKIHLSEMTMCVRAIKVSSFKSVELEGVVVNLFFILFKLSFNRHKAIGNSIL